MNHAVDFTQNSHQYSFPTLQMDVMLLLQSAMRVMIVQQFDNFERVFILLIILFFRSTALEYC